MEEAMKFTVELLYEKPRGWSQFRRPYINPGEKVLSEVKDKSVTIEFELKPGYSPTHVEGIERLADHPSLVTKDNVLAVWAIIKRAFSVNKVPYRGHGPLLHRMTDALGYFNYESLFEIIYNQEGWGFMGGTGCGTLVHKLKFHKIMGVKPELTKSVTAATKNTLGVVWALASLRFNLILGEVKAVRLANKHLRDTVKEEDIFVTLEARPICQATVAYVGAHGYCIRGAQENAITCTKCAKKLNLPIDPKKRKVGTPDSVDCGAYRIYASFDSGYSSRSYSLYFNRLDKAELSDAEKAHFLPSGRNVRVRATKANALVQGQTMVSQFVITHPVGAKS
jgi:hypothetical protein